jgi:hypothetical protein
MIAWLRQISVKISRQCCHSWQFWRTNQDFNLRQGHICRLHNGIHLLKFYFIALIISQLNLKNDTLRRRYDSLKYDIKKVEEGLSRVSSFRYQVTTHGRFMQWFMMSLFENLLPPLHKLNTLQNNFARGRATNAYWKLKLTFPILVLCITTDPFIIYKETSLSEWNISNNRLKQQKSGSNRSFNHLSSYPCTVTLYESCSALGCSCLGNA